MVDMLALTNLDTSAAKAPPELPDGIYPVVIAGWKVGPCRWSEDLGTITVEARPTALPEGVDVATLDVTKRRIFKEFHVNPAQVDTYFYLNMFVDACGVKRAGKRPAEYLPELVGQETSLFHQRRSYVKKDGTPGEAADVKMVIDGKVITERRGD